MSMPQDRAPDENPTVKSSLNSISNIARVGKSAYINATVKAIKKSTCKDLIRLRAGFWFDKTMDYLPQGTPRRDHPHHGWPRSGVKVKRLFIGCLLDGFSTETAPNVPQITYDDTPSRGQLIEL